MMLVYVLLLAVVVALLVAIYVGTGGRAWFRAPEEPQKLIGRTVLLKDCEWLGSAVSLPPATVRDYDSAYYRLDFVRPVEVEGQSESSVRVRSRHAGYPASGAAQRSTWVGATLESGRGFIARLEVLRMLPHETSNQSLEPTAGRCGVHI